MYRGGGSRYCPGKFLNDIIDYYKTQIDSETMPYTMLGDADRHARSQEPVFTSLGLLLMYRCGCWLSLAAASDDSAG